MYSYLYTCIRAQWEMKYIAWSMWRQLVNIHPGIFTYTGPRCIYYDLRTNSRTCSLKQCPDGECVFKIERCPELVSREKIIEHIMNSSKDPWNNNTLI